MKAASLLVWDKKFFPTTLVKPLPMAHKMAEALFY